LNHKSFRADAGFLSQVIDKLEGVPFSLLIRKLLEMWVSGKIKVEL